MLIKVGFSANSKTNRPSDVSAKIEAQVVVLLPFVCEAHFHVVVAV